MRNQMTGTVIGTGSYIPTRFMDNDELSQGLDTNDEWIRERTGVSRRHIVGDETTSQMAIEAAKSAILNGDVEPADVDIIIVSTITPNVLFPSVSCEVQKAIGAIHATCFDLSAACAGFLFAYQTAEAYIASGMAKTILLVGSESLSKIMDWNDRGSCILFGDGAGAAVIKAAEEKLFCSQTCSDGMRGDVLSCESIFPEEVNGSLANKHIQMVGKDVFRFAVKTVPISIMEVLKKAEIEINEIDWFILHQANARIIEAVAKRLGVDMSKFPMNISEYGNTSSASIPILLDEMHRDGRLKRGEKIVLSGFGAGLSWGSIVTQW